MEKLRRQVFGFSLEDTLTLGNFKVVEYFPYTSIVTMRIVEQHDLSVFNGWLDSLWNSIEKYLWDEHKIMPDNKVAVRLSVKPDVFSTRNPSNDFLLGSVYVGCKDGKVSIGFGVWQPDDWTKKHNIKFE